MASPTSGAAPGWPVVAYFHHVSPTLRHYTSLSPQEFAVALDLLLEWLTPVDPASALGEPESQEAGRVLLTFDDGYADNFEYAAPILESRGVRALFFVITDVIGSGPGQRATDPEPRYLTLGQVEDLAHRGHQIGAHSKTHRKLPALPAAAQREEVAGSIADLERMLDRPCRAFAHPYGLPPSDSGALRELDGRWAFGTVKAAPQPWSQCPWNIRRTYLTTGAPVREWQRLVRGWAGERDSPSPSSSPPGTDRASSPYACAASRPPARRDWRRS